MAAALDVQSDGRGVRFSVQVQPRARRNEIAGVQGEALKVRLTAPPVEGAANRALTEFLAAALGVKAHQVHLLRGATSRLKVVAVDGIAAADVLRLADTAHGRT